MSSQARDDPKTHVCDECGQVPAGKLVSCARCMTACYCTRQCAEQAWTRTPYSLHRYVCRSLAHDQQQTQKRIKVGVLIGQGGDSDDEGDDTARTYKTGQKRPSSSSSSQSASRSNTSGSRSKRTRRGGAGGSRKRERGFATGGTPQGEHEEIEREGETRDSDTQEQWIRYQHRSKRRRGGIDVTSDVWRSLPADVKRWRLGGLPVSEFVRLYQMTPSVQRVVDVERDAFIWQSRQLYEPLRLFLRQHNLGLRALFTGWRKPVATQGVWPASENWLQAYVLLSQLQPKPEFAGYASPFTIAYLKQVGAVTLLQVLEELGAPLPIPGDARSADWEELDDEDDEGEVEMAEGPTTRNPNARASSGFSFPVAPTGGGGGGGSDAMDMSSAYIASLCQVMGIYDATHQDRRVYPFFSNAKSREHYALSNFYGAEFTWRAEDVSDVTAKAFPNLRTWLGLAGVKFPSSEHAWQALKATTRATFLKFSSAGEFGSLSVDVLARMAPLWATPKRRKNETQADWDARKTPTAMATAKVKAKSGKNMVGFVAKMASKPKFYTALGIADSMAFEAERGLTAQVEKAAWLDLLRQKYLQNDELKRMLLDTDDDYLLEFVRSAKREQVRIKNPLVEHWGGIIDDDGALWGENAMGRYLMAVRDEIHASEP